MKAEGPGRRGGDDGGQLLLLAGIILIMAFFLTSLSLGSLADLEKQTLSEQRNPLTTEFRLLRSSIGSTLDDATSRTHGRAHVSSLFNATAEGARSVEAGKGFEVVISLAAHNAPREVLPNGDWLDEHNLTTVYADGVRYYNMTLVSEDGSVNLGNVPYDGRNDGVIEVTTGCVQDPTIGCVQAVLAYLFLSDGLSYVTETVLYPVNNG